MIRWKDLKQGQMPYRSSTLSSVLVNGAPRALGANHKGQRRHFPRCLASSLCIDGRVGAPGFKPCEILCQMGSGLDSVDGVEAMFSKQTSRPSLVMLSHLGKGHKFAINYVPWPRLLNLDLRFTMVVASDYQLWPRQTLTHFYFFLTALTRWFLLNEHRRQSGIYWVFLRVD